MGAEPVQGKYLPFLAKCRTFSDNVFKIQLDLGPQGKHLVSCSTLELFYPAKPSYLGPAEGRQGTFQVFPLIFEKPIPG
jgi:hypothetical protein